MCALCVPVLLQCFRQSGAVLRVDAFTAHLHILQTSRKVTHISSYFRAEQQKLNLFSKEICTEDTLLLIKLKVLYLVVPVVFSAVVGEVVDLREGKKWSGVNDVITLQAHLKTSQSLSRILLNVNLA